MLRVPTCILSAALWGALPLAASACPVCASDLGQQVRNGIFDERFGFNLIATLLPFPILLGLAWAIHQGRLPLGRTRSGKPPSCALDAGPTIASGDVINGIEK